MISFFKDRDGTDYVVVVNTLQREATSITLSYTDKVEKASFVYRNGEQLNTGFERNGRTGSVMGGEIWLAPGQMEVLKIETE